MALVTIGCYRNGPIYHWRMSYINGSQPDTVFILTYSYILPVHVRAIAGEVSVFVSAEPVASTTRKVFRQKSDKKLSILWEMNATSEQLRHSVWIAYCHC